LAISIKQSATYLGEDRWSWSVWLDGIPSELDQVDHVIYVLHPTFHNPVRSVRDRSTGFRLETSGWGTFTLLAKVIHSNGVETTLKHDLLLRYPDGTPTAA